MEMMTCFAVKMRFEVMIVTALPLSSMLTTAVLRWMESGGRIEAILLEND